jgi:release factor glutamine methyltransferase
MKKKTWTVLEMIDWSRLYLAEKGFDNGRLETELLLGHALSLPRIELYLNHERQMNEGELARYKALLKRRLAGEPVQYVTGSAAFMFSEFEVNPSVLIPRPETEALCEVALKLLGVGTGAPEAAAGAAGPVANDEDGAPAADVGTEVLVADVGTGSGVIAVTVAQKLTRARVLATDSSAEALEVAARNAERAGVAGKVEFLEGHMLEPLAREGLTGRLALLVSNPPYVPSGDIASLPREIRDFEPRAALDGGPDGLDCLRTMAQDGPSLLGPGGAIALEVGDGQAEVVASMVRSSLGEAEIRQDYVGCDRIVAARRS